MKIKAKDGYVDGLRTLSESLKHTPIAEQDFEVDCAGEYAYKVKYNVLLAIDAPVENKPARCNLGRCKTTGNAKPREVAVKLMKVNYKT